MCRLFTITHPDPPLRREGHSGAGTGRQLLFYKPLIFIDWGFFVFLCRGLSKVAGYVPVVHDYPPRPSLA